MTALSTTEVRDELDDLYWRYCEALDEGPLEAWPGLFVAEASYRVVPRANFDRDLPLATMRCDSRAMMEDRVYALQSANFYVERRVRHVLGPLRVREVEGGLGEWSDAWHVRASFAVFETLSLSPTIVLAVGEYRDVVVRDFTGGGASEAEAEVQRSVGGEVGGGPQVGAHGFGPLRFAEKVVLNDSDLVPNSLVFPL